MSNDTNPMPLSPEWAKLLWALRQNHPDMTDTEWLEGFWGPHVTKTWREAEKEGAAWRATRIESEQHS